MPDESVSVVVPTLDRPDVLVDTVRDLLAQDWEPLEIVVVDQSADENRQVVALAGEHPGRLHYLKEAHRGLARARNQGWNLAVGQAVVFVDDDIRCGPDLVTEHMRALRRPGVGIVAGGIESGTEDACDEEIARFRRWSATPGGGFASHGEFPVEHARGANFSARRGTLETVGGFDEAFDVGAALYEELDFCLRARRAGFEIYFNGKARVRHLQAASGGCRVEGRDWLWGLAHNRARFARRHLRAYELPVAMLRLFVTGAAQAVRRRDLGLLGICMAGARAGLRGTA